MSEDTGVILIVVSLILVVASFVGGVIYGIIEDNNTCYNVIVEFTDGAVEEYHCSYYQTEKDCYLLSFHDKSKLVLLKHELKNIYFIEVKNENSIRN